MTMDAQEAIAAIAQMDLHTNDDAFSRWLARKKKRAELQNSHALQQRDTFTQKAHADLHTAAHTSPRINEHSSLHRSSQSAASRQAQLDEMLKKRTRSQEAFIAWWERKEEARLQAEEKEQRAKQAAELLILAQQTAEQVKAARVEAALKRWSHDKLEEYRRRVENEQAECALQQQKEREKREQAKIAFKNWRTRVEQEEKSAAAHAPNQPFAKHTNRWIDIPVEHAPPPPKSKTAYLHPSKELPILAPHNLYKDYSLYQQMAPSYLIKYPTQVASGGVGLSLHQFDVPCSKSSTSEPKNEHPPQNSRLRARTASVKPKVSTTRIRTASVQPTFGSASTNRISPNAKARGKAVSTAIKAPDAKTEVCFPADFAPSDTLPVAVAKLPVPLPVTDPTPWPAVDGEGTADLAALALAVVVLAAEPEDALAGIETDAES
ncbi:hypothetical protein HDU81_009758, partial [Chytriomyces hyalinus]